MNMHIARSSSGVFKTRKAPWASASLLFAVTILLSSSAFSLSAKRIAVKLRDNAEIINSLAVTLERTVYNTGVNGQMHQSFVDEERVWLSKPGRVVKRKVGQDEQLWDCTLKKRARKVSGGVVQAPYEGGVEEALPAILVYVVFPQYVLDRMKISGFTTQANRVILVGRPASLSKEQTGKARWEIAVDMDKGVIVEVRTFDEDGHLVEEVGLTGWLEHEVCWLPSLVIVRRHAARNVLTMRYMWKDLVVNNVNELGLRLK